MIARDRLKTVRFVKDHHVRVRKQADPSSAQGKVAEKQSMIDHQYLGMVDPSPGPVVETGVVRRTVSSHAVAAVASYLIPDSCSGPILQIRLRAIGCLRAPLLEFADFIEFAFIIKQRVSTFAGILEPSQAQVVAASFDQHSREFTRDHTVEQRQVFPQQLFLQADRVGRDDNPLGGRIRRFLRARASRGRLFAPLSCGEDGGDEIAKTFANPRTRFDD